jgi:TusA-related sulfurtransferase
MADIFHLDVTGLACPQPVLKTRELLDGGHRGPLTVGLDNDASAVNVATFLEGKGLKTQLYRQGSLWLILAHEADAPEILVWYGPDGWRAVMEDPAARAEGVPRAPRDGAVIELVQPEPPVPAPVASASAVPAPAAPEDPSGFVAVLAGSQFMGTGDEALGAELARSFFDALAAAGRPPRLIAFYNTGVLLTTRESSIVEALRDLERQGSVVISSGVCLEALAVMEQLKVGRIGGMYEIIDAQRRADRVIRL